ncbi:hypothetical protein PB1_13779 [Bacillus methanolicus PB1]|uniref:YprB ribonuclease H-like domain-containing protein n=1 Tax=Bacillus methanolicus PB1 TaxID=997296 RepID=I3DWL1_BACMT|nr:ribonuclease H-like domain-containing protein [Bacillus methanolicus]EIJ78632.1 hypothetical protein PB1_13779 [Bacillus methanolicus PB1]
MIIKNKLNRLKSHLVREEKSIHIEKQNVMEIPFLDEWKKENALPFFFDNSYCFVREVVYPLSYQHGKYRFSDFIEAVHAWNHSDISHPLSAAGYEPGDLFFFDTETTGLGGGAGNTIFLLGHASVSGLNIILKQHILPHPGAEIPLYQSFLENVDYMTLVTYNGKSFDWPQVKTRHTLIREHVPKLPPFGHFDLYHASRRIWKHKLDNIKLSTVEKEILEIERKDDIPGFLAPMIYFDFVERKNPEGMFGILKHNERDILSLITLYTHLSFQLLGLDANQTSKETFEVGRWYSALGESKAARSVFSQLANLSGQEAIPAKLALAYEQKKQKNWDEALPLFNEVCKHGNKKAQKEAFIEAAKLLEHWKKDYDQALNYAEKAKKIHEEQLKVLRVKSDSFLMEINRRITRLSKKITAHRDNQKQ